MLSYSNDVFFVTVIERVQKNVSCWNDVKHIHGHCAESRILIIVLKNTFHASVVQNPSHETTCIKLK